MANLRSTERFWDRASAYAAHRPSYPSDAVDAVLAGLGDPHDVTVADVGAGTGISARLFADRGATVMAIEPNAAMRASAAPHPRVTWREGTAQSTGLPDAAADVVVAAQAFHWFATGAAMGELARIARRRVAMLQYERDESDAFTRAYGDVVRAYARDDTEAIRSAAMGVFERFPNARVARTAFALAQRLTLGELLGRASSASYLPNDGPAAHALQRDLTTAFERAQRDGNVNLVMVTHVLVADLCDR